MSTTSCFVSFLGRIDSFLFFGDDTSCGNFCFNELLLILSDCDLYGFAIVFVGVCFSAACLDDLLCSELFPFFCVDDMWSEERLDEEEEVLDAELALLPPELVLFVRTLPESAESIR